MDAAALKLYELCVSFFGVIIYMFIFFNSSQDNILNSFYRFHSQYRFLYQSTMCVGARDYVTFRQFLQPMLKY